MVRTLQLQCILNDIKNNATHKKIKYFEGKP